MRAPRNLLTLLLALALIAPGGEATAVPAASAAAATAAAAQPGCGYVSEVDDLLNALDQESYTTWVRRLSGGEDVLVNGSLTRVNTRYSPSLFNGTSAGFDYLTAQIRAWARAKGMTVPDRGRLRPEIHQAWRDVHEEQAFVGPGQGGSRGVQLGGRRGSRHRRSTGR